MQRCFFSLDLCLFRVSFVFSFNTIVTNDESDEQKFQYFLHQFASLFFLKFEFNSIEYESNCI